MHSKGLYYASSLEFSTEIHNDVLPTLSNSHQFIAEKVDDGKKIEIVAYVNYGSGFITREENFAKFAAALPIDTIFLDTNYTTVSNMQYYVKETIIDKHTLGEELHIIIGKEKHNESMKEIFLCACSNMGEMFSKLAAEKSVLDTVSLDTRRFDGGTEAGEPIMLEDIEISNRSYNCMKSCGIHDLRKMSSLTRKELESVRNLGKVSLNEIISLMRKYSIRFKDEV